MKIATIAYQRLINSKGTRSRLWDYLCKMLVWLARDPDCLMQIHKKMLVMPLSHPLPRYMKSHENYDRLPKRISKYLRQVQGKVTCIDVGANIGDSIAAFYNDDKDSVLAIEPSQKYQKYLVANWGNNKRVKIIDAICSSEDTSRMFSIKEESGTASIRQAKTGINKKTRTLDFILTCNEEFEQANILKIDTDGHDFDVIAGAKNLILRSMPMVLIECDAFGNTRYVEDCLRVLDFSGQLATTRFYYTTTSGILWGNTH